MEQSNTKVVIAWSVGIFAFIVFLFWALPMWNVWSASLSGKAALNHADFERQVQVVNAQANLEAQKFNAQAEVERAKGVAQANQIIADGLKGHDEYLRYLWITNLEQGTGRETVYIPTEAGLPILEARNK